MKRPVVYEIRVHGHLEAECAGWFDELEITTLENGETALTGPIPDQPALHGILRKICSLGLPLISVNQAGTEKKRIKQDTTE
jgi:hypothetical protein